MSSITNIGQRLYRGEVSYDFVGRWKRWYIFSAITAAGPDLFTSGAAVR